MKKYFTLLLVAYLITFALFINAESNYKNYIGNYLLQTTFYKDTYYSSHTSTFNALEAAQKMVLLTDTIDYHLLNACIVFHTNAYRVKMKKKPLQFSVPLRDAAVFHALQMNEKNFFSHTNAHNKKMKTPAQRSKYFGYPNELVGENITREFAINYKEKQPYIKEGNTFYYANVKKEVINNYTYYQLAENIVASWINSPPHKKNMLMNFYTHIGCAAIMENQSLLNDNMPMVIAVQNFGGK
jgi:uncharacterized protein YkwD